MERNELRTDRLDGDVVQADSVHGGVHFHQHTRRTWITWAAIAVVLVLVGLSAAAWRTDALRVKELAGTPRGAQQPATTTPALTTMPSTTATSTARPPIAQSEKALAPLDVTVIEHPPQTCKHGWVVPDTGAAKITEVWTPSTSVGRPKDSVLGDGGWVKVTVQGRHDVAVVLDSIRVEVVARRPAMKGLFLPTTCGSSLNPRYFALDLSQRAPRAVPQPGHDGPDVIPAVDFPFKVTTTDVESFIFTVASPKEDIDWRLHLRWSSAGETRDLPIDDNGKPFRTTSTKAAKPYCFTYGSPADGPGWVPPGTTTDAPLMCP